ncbi:unnamed protein product [marine sediment metagenome]|uniref:Uncharacterized protein n=1 Tax=marine sediment metagenome TaxID=412755 RepID=X1CU05_9ZZZZ
MESIKEWSKQSTTYFIIAFILLGFGSTYLVIDYCSIPTTEQLRWEGTCPCVTDRHFGDPSKAFKIGLGDGFISNIESIFIFLCIIIGIFNFGDFIFSFDPKKDNDVKVYFRKIINSWKNKRKDGK